MSKEPNLLVPNPENCQRVLNSPLDALAAFFHPRGKGSTTLIQLHTWHTAEAATGGPRQGGKEGVPRLGRAP